MLLENECTVERVTPPSSDRVIVENWNEKDISGTIAAGDAVRLNIYLANRRMMSLDSSVPLVHFDKTSFRVNTQYFPVGCLVDLDVTIEHADGAVSSLRRELLRPGSNVVPHSLYGGMWIDFPDWEERLAEKLFAGEISEALAGLIRAFVRDGYVIIPQAVSSEIIAELNGRMIDVWSGNVAGHKIEIYDGIAKVLDVDNKYYNQPHKLLDSYAFIPAAQHGASAPAVVEFMTAIFEDKPKAFQQLTFEWGSQQPIHKDTAYVKIDGNPMSMLATWLALEDISEGTGELEFYVGSHRAPDYIFGTLSKWMEAAPDEHEDFLAALHTDAEKYGHPRSSFLAKAGDVLIWHADLAHGGSAITQPGFTRRSQVTHFTAAKNAPFYCRWSQFSSNERNGAVFVSRVRTH